MIGGMTRDFLTAKAERRKGVLVVRGLVAFGLWLLAFG